MSQPIPKIILDRPISGIRVSEIKRQDPLSLFKEDLIIDEIDKQSQCKKYERRYLKKLSLEDYEGAEKTDNLLLYVERPWERAVDVVPNFIRYTPEDLVKMYADKFPDELKQDE